MKVRTSKIDSIDDLPEQLEVIDGRLVVIGTTDAPNFPDFEGQKVTLIPRDYMVWLIQSRDFLRKKIEIEELINSIEYRVAVKEKESENPKP